MTDDKSYEETWGSPIGKDCINLDGSLCSWLGTRMVWLAKHTQSYPIGYDSIETYNHDLTRYGLALKAYDNNDDRYTDDDRLIALKAKEAMHWVASNLETLWD